MSMNPLPAMVALLVSLCATAGAEGLSAAGPPACLPGGEAGLEMRITGDFEADVRWGNTGTRCDGGPRPEGDALRLMFAHEGDGLLIVLGITGLERAATGSGLLANVTVVRQGLGLFYGTLGADSCVVNVDENAAIEGMTDAYRISGQGRCEAPIEAINRDGHIRVAPFEFTGVVHWPDENEDEARDD
jgi:hypothetical protein